MALAEVDAGLVFLGVLINFVWQARELLDPEAYELLKGDC